MKDIWLQLWQLNIEFSLLLIAVLGTRLILRKVVGVNNAYLLWAALPLGIMTALLAYQLEVVVTPLTTVPAIINDYVEVTGQTVQSIPTEHWINFPLIWLVVAIVLLVRLAGQHYLLRRELVALTEPLTHKLESSYAIKGIHKPNFSPAVYGFIRPTIYFPNHLFRELEASQIELIVRHEEQHIKQKHLWLNMLWDILVCVMWFNPMLYIGRQKFRHDQELFCDYLVLNNRSEEQQKSYGLALLSTVGAGQSVSLLCFWRAFNQLEDRIMNINQEKSRSARIATCSGALLVILAASLYGVSAKEQSLTQSLPQQESLHIEHFDDQWNIEWEKNGDRFVRDNNDYYVIDSDSVDKRPMNNVERLKFEQKLEASKTQKRENEVARRIAREAHAQQRHQERVEQHELRKKQERVRMQERQSQQTMLKMEREALTRERGIAVDQVRRKREKARAESELLRAEVALARAEKLLSRLNHKQAMDPKLATKPQPTAEAEKPAQPSLPELPQPAEYLEAEESDFDPARAH